jgi:hypothetical protein
MASVVLAGSPRVNDKLQTRPTVYKSGTLVEAPHGLKVTLRVEVYMSTMMVSGK